MDLYGMIALCLLGSVMGMTPKLMCSDWQGKLISPGVKFYPKAEDPCYECYCGEKDNRLMGMTPKLMCSDWQGKLISPGVKFYPKAEDPCYECYCGEKGSPTSCMTVSCAPPSCPMGYRTVSGKCCHFECTDTGDNTTGLVPPKDDVTGKAAEDSMTDLGLRLVASTVTTFLILAVLLVLIHRLRQRRLLVALRRYGHRREPLDDSDNLSFSPDYFGIQCPPYADPPPPYTLPKPPYFTHGDQPPPYEEVVENNEHTGNQAQEVENQSGSSRSRNEENQSEQNGIPGSSTSPIRESRNGVTETRREHSHLCNNSHNYNETNSPERHSGIVHFRNGVNGGQINITMGVQNRTRNNRNRFSDSQFSVTPSRNAQTRNLNVNQINGLNLEIRNGFQNLHNHGNCIPLQPIRSEITNTHRHGNLSSSSTDIGESSSSAESLESSPNFSPDSPDVDGDGASPPRPDLTDDADMAVKQFMDRQFGPKSRVRRYPTTMSQSWTSAQLGSVGTPNFSHSISLGSFLPNQDGRNDATSDDKSKNKGGAVNECKNLDNHLLRSKSEQLKTNGSLKSPPFKGIVRSHTTANNLPLPQTSFGARVSYVEPDELSRFMNDQRRAKSGDFSHFCHTTSSQDNIDSNVSECSSSSQNPTNLSIRSLDPDKIIVSKRQDLLRELRLSHLLQHPDQSPSHSTLPSTSGKVSNLDKQTNKHTHRKTYNSDTQGAGIAISNDAHYPDNSYRNSQHQTQTRATEQVKQDSNTGNINNENTSDTSSLISYNDSSRNSSPVKSLKSKIKDMGTVASMSQSWHGNKASGNDDDMFGFKPGTDTLGRNVNSHFDKKVADKDVSNLFFPQFKPLYDNGPIIGKDSIPSSDKRACAAQMYNSYCEPDDHSSKKSKRKHLHKRHSAGCFPVKREIVQSNQHPPTRPKMSHKQKSIPVKDRQSSHRYSDCLSDKIKGQHYNRTLNPSSNDIEQSDITDLTLPCMVHTNIAQSTRRQLNDQRDTDRHTTHPSRNQKRRSKSLGRIENVRSPEKRLEKRQSRSKPGQQFVPVHVQNDSIVPNSNNECTNVKTLMNDQSESVSQV